MLAAREAAAYKAGHKSPHLVLISDYFPANKKNIFMRDVADAYEEVGSISRLHSENSRNSVQ